MDDLGSTCGPMYRLWIATYSDWRPSEWNQVPPRATALEPVDDGLVSADEAALFLEGFNRSMLGEHDRPIWAVAVPHCRPLRRGCRGGPTRAGDHVCHRRTRTGREGT
jgi:hypothetical protein